MAIEWFIARRYLTARRRQAFISLISGVSILGVSVGVMALIIALALMTGVQGELRDRILGSTAHVIVSRIGGAFEDVPRARQQLTLPGVVAVAPAIVGYGLLGADASTSNVVTVKGIDPAAEALVSDIAEAVAPANGGTGSLEALVQRPADALDGVILGADLAAALGVRVGDIVDLVTSEVTSTLTGLVPHRRPLQVVGTSHFGFYEFDSAYAFVSLSTAAELLNRPGPDMMEIKLADLDQAPAIRRKLEEDLGADYRVQDWVELNGPLYPALWLEKVAISLTIGLIVMVAALNIVASLVLLVMEKSRDIAILRTMGASSRVIRRIFIYQGLTIGLLGTGVGTVLGLVVSFVADRYRLISLPPDVYQITHLPFRVLPLDVLIVVASAIAVCLAATIYPSRQAARIDPAEALRNQ